MEIGFLFKNIECGKFEKLGDIYNKFIKNQLVDINKMLFYYNHDRIDPKDSLYKIATFEDLKRNNITFILEEKIKNNCFKSKRSNMSTIRRNAQINIDNYKIKIFCLKNNHKYENISLEDFYTYQKKGFSNIKCEKCFETRNNVDKNNFFICYKCGINLCPECKLSHNQTHYIFDYTKKYNYCEEHNHKKHISYCEYCQKNLCSDCEKFHENNSHKIIEFKENDNNIYLKDIIDDIKYKKEEFIKISENL